ncbi:hypothetical protein ACFQDZ_01370 [Sulfitobacter pacificus]|uniref:hypothetical protein n=1 Tax=Sulfitobacter pacificus TaxID=1499314 RepID=UPI0036191F82
MNYSILSGPGLLALLRQEVRNPDCEACFAVAYLGAGLHERLEMKDMTKVKIVCDFVSGGTNPEGVKEIQNLGGCVRHLDGLHAKIGIVGKRLSFVGSSNLTENGLSDLGTNKQFQRLERSVVFDGVDPKVAVDFEQFWEAAAEITDNMKKSAKEAWARRLRHRAIEQTRKAKPALSDLLRHSPATLDSLGFHMMVCHELHSKDEPKLEKAEKELSEVNSVPLEAWWGQASVPDKGVFVDYTVHSGNDPKCNKLYRRDKKLWDDIGEGEDSFQALRKIKSYKGVQCKKRMKTFCGVALNVIKRKCSLRMRTGMSARLFGFFYPN